ncbi:MAG: DUF4369 domain-containing protein [Flavobacteriaceae bacterium]|nr:DUF4369 domain-containing protein [Flavobacteriaceae bacterium]
MKKIIFVVTLFLLLGCKNNINKNMNVNINIKNFKKGHVYLQKVTDSAIVNIDSIFVKNEKPIIFEYDVDSPELFYVNLDISKLDNRIEFFGEKGNITIDTSLEKFNSDFKINGSYNDSIYREYLKIIKQFNNKKLDLIELSFNLSKANQVDSLVKVQKNLETLNKSQYLYNLNYVVSNGDKFISPLIAINEFSQASKVIKDTIRKSMSKEVQESKYGKIFEKLVEKTRVN